MNHHADDPLSGFNQTTEWKTKIKTLCVLYQYLGINLSNPNITNFPVGDETNRQQICDSLSNYDPPESDQLKNILIGLAYGIIVIISLIGNLFVLWAIFSKRRMRTTVNIFIGNLAFSDLMMTVFNIPFNCARLLMAEWVFGEFLCHTVPFVLVVSVYVSTLTMTFIAIDRYQAIITPMRPRISSKIASKFTIGLIWIISMIFAIPFGIFNRLVEDTLFTPVLRCKVQYPSPAYRKSINVGTFTLQFALPLILMVCLYTKICFRIWSRETIGATTPEQQSRQISAKRKTIFMLLLVAIVFAICWLPLNLYHLLTDFWPDFKLGFNFMICCHWLAMSSVCYNPFIYFCLNRRFKSVMRTIHCWCWKGSDSGTRAAFAVDGIVQRNGCVRMRQSFGSNQSTTVHINVNNSDARPNNHLNPQDNYHHRDVTGKTDKNNSNSLSPSSSMCGGKTPPESTKNGTSSGMSDIKISNISKPETVFITLSEGNTSLNINVNPDHKFDKNHMNATRNSTKQGVKSKIYKLKLVRASSHYVDSSSL